MGRGLCHPPCGGSKISASVQGTAGRRHHRLLCRVFPVGTKTGQVPADTDPGAAPAGRGTGEKAAPAGIDKGGGAW